MSSYNIVRTDEEITALVEKCNNASSEGRTGFSDLTYEDGITEVLAWLTNPESQNPLDYDA